MTIVELIGVVQCLFIAVALLYLPGNHKQANRWLAALFCVFALEFAHQTLQQNDLIYLAPLLTLLRLPLVFVFGPLLYLYLHRITQPWDTRPAWAFRWHFLPFGVAVLAYLPSLGLDRNQLLQLIYYKELVRLYPYATDLNATQQWLGTITSAYRPYFVLHLGACIAASLHLLILHKRRAREHFSRLDKVSLDWMRNLLLALVAIWCVVSVRHLLFGDSMIGVLIMAGLTPVLVLFLSALGLFGLLQKSIPLPYPPSVADAPPAASAASKYQGSTLTPAQQAEGLARLQCLMQQARPYLDSELTLTGLAAQLGMPARHLSQIINAGLGQNFLDFINGFRIDEARRLLADNACNHSILTIAMDVGFNSKSAFYSAFRRHVGQTPSQYRRACMNTLGAGRGIDHC